MDSRKKIDIGYLDIPKEYLKFSDEDKKLMCNNLIDMMLYIIDKQLDPTYNRITFLDQLLESSLISNEELEQYEVAQVLYDCRKILNEA
jgi:hypothetical protein